VKPWDDLKAEERAAYDNGVGPWWLPAWPRRALTRLSGRFFQEADWAHHDYGYATRAAPRTVCDLRFLQAMLRDASAQPGTGATLAATVLAVTFWMLVRLFGWASYGRDIEEAK
jgi:hypothetical protein